VSGSVGWCKCHRLGWRGSMETTQLTVGFPGNWSFVAPSVLVRGCFFANCFAALFAAQVVGAPFAAPSLLSVVTFTNQKSPLAR